MEKILLKNITVIDENSAFHCHTTDIFIADGMIVSIGESNPEAGEAKVIQAEGLIVSPGWVDMRALCGEPGYEHRETLHSLSQVAAAGGYTDVALLPNTFPVIQTADAVAAVKNFRNHLPVAFHPIAAASVESRGEEMTELMDLHYAGAVAFSDGIQPIYKSTLIVKLLLYLQQFGGLLMNLPSEKHLAASGQMHEGVQSTQLGLKGIPTVCETLGISQQLQLLQYAGGRLHFSCISSAAGVELIRRAKAEGFHITADVASYHLAFTDADLDTFDTNLKVIPPLRSQEDRMALIEGLHTGVIDAIVSNHIPLESEAKQLEFDLAEFGMINLQTSFAVANTFGNFTPQTIVRLLATNPRKILGLSPATIQPNAQACLTIFHPCLRWTFQPIHNYSFSANSPFFGQDFTGCPVATIRDGKFFTLPFLPLMHK
ncbi:MAG: dihydroorotase [Cytophagales bacterium]|nr:dihydroorotase [Bernardetiaceae bacterium]MDW8210876.1 dihydroorotase [Cytophagales bacterium]